MKLFASTAEMIQVHEAMFGPAGRVCAEAVIRYAGVFDEPFDPLAFRVILAPVELGPYGKHMGYTVTQRSPDAPRYILGNRCVCGWEPDGSIALTNHDQFTTDFVVHEMTHHRQAILLDRHGIKKTRGDHRDAGWYGAIAEAAPRYLGVSFPQSVWPMQRPKPGRVTEVEATHWPNSFRTLIAADDPRLKSSVDDTARPANAHYVNSPEAFAQSSESVRNPSPRSTDRIAV